MESHSRTTAVVSISKPDEGNTDMDELESLLTVNEVAKLLRLSPQTLYKMLEQGTIPAVKVGCQWRFERSKIREWLSEQQTTDSPRKQSVA